ncbi:hypothetical protein [Acinetobacter soli]|uniref:hypothetical protein n=1 Tax=Acinetobacter soli TaxID=487316 RepID=UPI001250B20D|nr:hypothetical protein [Acinetobacter soli]
METQEVKKAPSKTGATLHTIASAIVITGLTTATAFAADGDTNIDLTTGLASVAVVAGLMATGTLKALPTYVAWGIRKALSMLR